MAAAELLVLTDAETAAYDMMKLAVFEVGREYLPLIELGARWKGGEILLKPVIRNLRPRACPSRRSFTRS